MDRVGVRELRQNLSVYLRRVRSGEALEVTERGEPVARLEPIRDLSDPLGRLTAAGVLRPTGSGDVSRLGRPEPWAGRPVSEVLREMRDEDSR